MIKTCKLVLEVVEDPRLEDKDCSRGQQDCRYPAAMANKYCICIVACVSR